MSSIVYTYTDEAPALATHSLLPIVKAFTATCGVKVELRDISLAGRVLAAFPEYLQPGQRVQDALEELGKLAKTPGANIIKLPNISASIPQLQEAVRELRGQGFMVPEYPGSEEVRKRYARVLGSAVNPVLREGNSDRRVAAAVKRYAKQHPHPMGAWQASSRTHVASMDEGDFYSSESSHVVGAAPDDVSIIFKSAADGRETTLKPSVPLQPGEVIDAASMSEQALRRFFRRSLRDSKQQGVLFSLHLKATMMKVSDPIMFGVCVEELCAAAFQKHGAFLESMGAEASNGLGAVLAKAAAAGRADVVADFERCLLEGPSLAMVDSSKGITNLHVPSDVIIDASMPAMIRASGQMWNRDNKQQDTKACIPDRCYAAVFSETIEFCKENGAFDPRTMGNVSNVGLMAKKAEEYGSHDKTFRAAAPGEIRVVSRNTRKVLLRHRVEKGDIWRMCQTKDDAIRDWVKLAVSRARKTGSPAVFWLDPARAHDRCLMQKVKLYLKDHDTSGLTLPVMSPVQAVRHALQRLKEGRDTIAVTGNVLRDYLTDLFPILELGTSAKMLSVVPLLAGGGLFETGAGGSAPKHVQQFLAENHLRWDSLGEFLALAVSLEDLSGKTGQQRAAVLAKALDEANARFLEANKSPSRKVRELDNRGSHFYLALFWADALAKQTQDKGLQDTFAPLASALAANENRIVAELNAVQGKPVGIGGYYRPSPELASAAMRPSGTFNTILDTFFAKVSAGGSKL